jgi:hypothetical protein
VSWTLGRAVAGMGSWPSRLVAGGGHGGRTFVALAAVLSRAAARAVSDVVESADAGGELLWPATEPHATGGVLFFFFLRDFGIFLTDYVDLIYFWFDLFFLTKP